MISILGVDPGYGRTGIAYFRYEKNHLPLPEKIFTIETDPEISREKRYLQLHTELEDFLKGNKVCFAGIEEIYLKTSMERMNYNIEARGIIILSLALRDIPIDYFQPNSVKKAVTGSGRAKKNTVKLMVQKLLNIDSIPGPDDASDAAAIAMALWLRRKNHDCPDNR